MTNERTNTLCENIKIIFVIKINVIIVKNIL